MRKTLAWLSGTTAGAAAMFTHGPLFVVLVIYTAIVLAAVVVSFTASVFFTSPCDNLVALIRAWRHGP
jgi:hypothetical protein